MQLFLQFEQAGYKKHCKIYFVCLASKSHNKQQHFCKMSYMFFFIGAY